MLRQNKIKTVDDTALRFYVELLYVDFSHNRYVTLDSTNGGPYLHLFFFFFLHRLVSIQDRTFEGQRKLTQLRLDRNKISVVGNVSSSVVFYYLNDFDGPRKCH